MLSAAAPYEVAGDSAIRQTNKERNVVDLDRIHDLDSVSKLKAKLMKREEEPLSENSVVATDSGDRPCRRDVADQDKSNQIIAEPLNVKVILLGTLRSLTTDFESHPTLTNFQAEEVLKPTSGVDDDITESRRLKSNEKGGD